MKQPYRLQKVSDEGSTEPYVARFWMGILELRNFALSSKFEVNYDEKVWGEYDEIYDTVLKATGACRNSEKKILHMLSIHKQKVQNGKIIKFQHSAVDIMESIDEDMNEQISAYLIYGVRALKGTQKVLAYFDINIGSFFQKQAAFDAGMKDLTSQNHSALSKFLIETRTKWSESFINRRNSIEHEGWSLDKIKYPIIAPQRVIAIEPKIDGIDISIYVKKMTDLILSFVENIIIYSLQSVLPPSVMIVEIPEDKRDPIMPIRFKLDLRRPGIREWVIKYEENDFKKRIQPQKTSSPPSLKPKQKVRRNDLCPCGSGKKYKKCCLNR